LLTPLKQENQRLQEWKNEAMIWKNEARMLKDENAKLKRRVQDLSDLLAEASPTE
jgi:hypothetical protein